MMRNGSFVFENCLFIQSHSQMLLVCSSPENTVVKFQHCVFDRALFPLQIQAGLPVELIEPQTVSDEMDWIVWIPCWTMMFTSISADYSGPRRVVGIVHFILLLADALPFS
jgi:hypothetical protein